MAIYINVFSLGSDKIPDYVESEIGALLIECVCLGFYGTAVCFKIYHFYRLIERCFEVHTRLGYR